MARQRIIQPEFWSDAKVARLSLRARLLFMGLWSFADDGGVHPDDVLELRLRIFPGDLDATEKSMLACLDELVEQHLVVRFCAQDGGKYLQVRNWDRHQTIRKPHIRHPQYDTSAAPVQHQCGTRTTPVQHQDGTSTTPVRAESESESETQGREEGKQLHRHVAATRANSRSRAKSRQRNSERTHDPPPPPA